MIYPSVQLQQCWLALGAESIGGMFAGDDGMFGTSQSVVCPVQRSS